MSDFVEKSTLKKSGFVVILGRPNVGKSTLMNHLIGQKIAITSDKPQTTRDRIQTVYTEERGQIIFLDTPGIHRAKNRLGKYMEAAGMKALSDADLTLWMVDAKEKPDREGMFSIIKHSQAPVILAINKLDTLKDPALLLPLIDAYKDMHDFAAIVPISGLCHTNTDRLLEVLFAHLPQGPLYFDEDTVTDQSMRQIAEEIIREKALRCLSDELPHGIAVQIASMSPGEKGIWNIEADLICEKESHKGMIIGKEGKMLERIGSLARADIERLVEGRVYLKLWVKVRNKWRDSERQLKSFGYKAKER